MDVVAVHKNTHSNDVIILTVDNSAVCCEFKLIMMMVLTKLIYI